MSVISYTADRSRDIDSIVRLFYSPEIIPGRNPSMNTWAVLLAGGDGTRLKSLTTLPNGVAIPKQYCSLRGGASLIQKALKRAVAVASPGCICAVVAEQHRDWHREHLRGLEPEAVLEQPHNRGTGHGVLLALLHILRRDPLARVAFLPVDHFIAREDIFASVLAAAVRDPTGEDAVLLLGAVPDERDTELGYIVPSTPSTPSTPSMPATSAPVHVAEFVENPTRAQVSDLLARQALWNSSVMVSSVRALLGLFGVEFAFTIANIQKAFAYSDNDVNDATALRSLYSHLPTVDLSRDILQPHTSRLRVLAVPDCGWTDLGTPARVAHAMQWLQTDDLGSPLDCDVLDLAIQSHRLDHANATRVGIAAV